MTTIKDYLGTKGCGTGVLHELNHQILATILEFAPGSLISCESLVEISDNRITIPYLQPAACAALAGAVEEMGNTRLKLVHAFRTVAQQYLIYSWYRHGRCAICLAAPPGTSRHEAGLAIDTSDYNSSKWKSVLANHGWRWRGPADKAHFTYVGNSSHPQLQEDSVRAFQRLWNKHNPMSQIAEDGIYGDKETGASLLMSPVTGW
jgi:N-acetylmuramoyl-L-alanine amidase